MLSLMLMCACAAALPLNPDDNAADVKREERQEEQRSQPSSQQSSQHGSQQAPARTGQAAPQTGQKRPAANASPAGKLPGGKRAKKEAPSHAKGQKTMQAFFAAK